MTHDDDKPLTPTQARQKLQQGLADYLAGKDSGPIVFRLKRTKNASHTYPLKLTQQQRGDWLSGYIILCFLLAIGLELAALGCGIAARHSTSGKAGIVISGLSLLAGMFLFSLTALSSGHTSHAPPVRIEALGSQPAGAL